jgi:CysZ protein
LDNSTTQGFHYAIQGFRSLLLPKLRGYLIWPLIINILIFGVFFGYGLHFLWVKLTVHFSLPNWLQWLNSLFFAIKLSLITIIATFFLGIFTILATMGANLIGAPFNGLLSEAFSKEIAKSKPPAQSFGKLMLNTIKREMTKFLYFLPRMLGAFILASALYFVPVLNILSPVLLYWFGAWMMAIQYLDYPADNYHIPFEDFLTIIKQEKPLCLGFGLTISLLASIPFANFIVMPAAVLGATAIWHDKLSTHKAK